VGTGGPVSAIAYAGESVRFHGPRLPRLSCALPIPFFIDPNLVICPAWISPCRVSPFVPRLTGLAVFVQFPHSLVLPYSSH